jgi:hypothetical protein
MTTPQNVAAVVLEHLCETQLPRSLRTLSWFLEQSVKSALKFVVLATTTLKTLISVMSVCA